MVGPALVEICIQHFEATPVAVFGMFNIELQIFQLLHNILSYAFLFYNIKLSA